MSEALAMVDLLVLVHADRFAGWFLSSFSWAVQARELGHAWCIAAAAPRVNLTAARGLLTRRNAGLCGSTERHLRELRCCDAVTMTQRHQT